MTMTREQLKRGFLFEDIGERMSWRDSYHETDSMAFAGAAKRLTCDGCGGIIAPGSLYSIGNRQVYPDAPLYGSWVDKVHFHCASYDTEAEALKHYGPPNKLPGWATVPDDEKSRILAAVGLEDTAENKAGISVFEGLYCVVVGEFSESKESISAEIEANGGKCLATITKSNPVTHIVLGADGYTQYGQKTGRGSKKYKDAMKKKPKPAIVDLAWVREAIKKNENIFAAQAGEEKKEETKAEKPTGRGKKRKAGAEEEGEKGEKEAGEEKEEEEEGEAKKAKTEEEADGDARYSRATLEAMKRKELQALCKKHSIKANSANTKLIEDLLQVKK